MFMSHGVGWRKRAVHQVRLQGVRPSEGSMVDHMSLRHLSCKWIQSYICQALLWSKNVLDAGGLFGSLSGTWLLSAVPGRSPVSVSGVRNNKRHWKSVAKLTRCILTPWPFGEHGGRSWPAQQPQPWSTSLSTCQGLVSKPANPAVGTLPRRGPVGV